MPAFIDKRCLKCDFFTIMEAYHFHSLLLVLSFECPEKREVPSGSPGCEMPIVSREAMSRSYG
jgi:hypothetical protein